MGAQELVGGAGRVGVRGGRGGPALGVEGRAEGTTAAVRSSAAIWWCIASSLSM